MLIKKINLLLIIFVFISNVNVYASKEFSVSALFETPQVKINGDADDPAIWFNETNPGLSIIFGTDKYNGIYSYNLKGETYAGMDQYNPLYVVERAQVDFNATYNVSDNTQVFVEAINITDSEVELYSRYEEMTFLYQDHGPIYKAGFRVKF